MNLVHDHGARAPQRRTAALRGQQNEERLGRRHQDVRRTSHHPLALPGGGVTSAHRRANSRSRQTAVGRQPLELDQRCLQILPDIVAQRLERRHVDHVNPVLEPPIQPERHQSVETDEKCGQRLAGSGGRRHEHIPSGPDPWPGFALWHGGRRKPPAEPLGDQWMEVLHRTDIGPVSGLGLRAVSGA